MKPRIIQCRGPLTSEQARELSAGNDVAAGRLVIASNDQDLFTATASAILDAICDPDGEPQLGRGAANSASVTLPWMLAHRVRHLLVLRADRLATVALDYVLQLGAATGATIWLTGHPTPSRHLDLFDDTRRDLLAPSEFLTTWRARTTPAEARPAVRPLWPAMPNDDFPTFRAAMHRLLPPHVAAAADELFVTTVHRYVELLRPLLSGDPGNPLLSTHQPANATRPVLDRARLDATVAHLLHQLVHESHAVPDLLVRVRAAQVAAFRLGWLLQVIPERIAATITEPSAAAVRHPGLWDALRTLRYPDVVATNVLAALGLDATTIATLPAHAIDPEGASVHLPERTIAVPPGAQPLLRAQLFTGQLEGRDPVRPLLFSRVEDRLSVRQVRRNVRAAYTKAGALLFTPQLDETWDGHSWCDRAGFRLREVA